MAILEDKKRTKNKHLYIFTETLKRTKMNTILKYELPINKDPWIRCYRIHANMLNIIGIAYPNFEKYVLSNYLCLHNRKEGCAREYLDFHLENNYLNIKDVFRNNDWFDIIQLKNINDKYYMNSKHCQEIIISFLNEGYYVLHNINEAYLPHSPKYKHDKEKSNNIALTYGYNRSEDVLYILDYAHTGNFGSSSVQINDYLDSIANVTVANNLNFIRAKKELEFRFDIRKSLKLLRCHINSQNAYLDHKDYDINIFGYEGVERTLNTLSTHGINMIRLRTLKEHKNIILKYLKYVIDNHYIDEIKYYEEYQKIEKNMEIIF